MNSLLDGAAMIQTRGEWVCCLLCLRQFESERKVLKHLAKSEMHAENLAAAVSAGRVSEKATAAGRKRPAPSLPEDERPSRERSSTNQAAASAAPPASSSSVTSSGFSALEQMELFEKRLKVQSKSKPVEEDPAAANYANLPNGMNHARTVNGQMDWECSYCNTFNFARVISCVSCHKQVDATTKYISNRLKEIKYERFKRYFANDDGGLGERAPNLSAVNTDPMRADGSVKGEAASRASFQR